MDGAAHAAAQIGGANQLLAQNEWASVRALAAQQLRVYRAAAHYGKHGAIGKRNVPDHVVLRDVYARDLWSGQVEHADARSVAAA